jgi:glutamate/tyrosine decarboxylase-like PLP-dependent enzyme
MSDPHRRPGPILEPELVGARGADARPALEALGARAWSDALDWLFGDATTRATGPETYAELRAAYFGEAGAPGPAPAHGRPAAEVLDELRDRVLPHLFAAQHPGAYSYFTPPPLPIAVAGEALAAWTNQGIDVWLSGMAAPFVEEDVIRWLCDLTGLPGGSWGVLASGGVMANVMGLAVARDVHLRRLRQLDGPPRGAALEGVRVYASDQAHFSIDRGLALLGFPSGTLRPIPSDERFRLRPADVADAIAEDRADGLLPFCVTPVAGSTNTGSVDPVGDLADLADRERLWLHVDAAYGGAARLSPRDALRVPGLERADSLTIDPHKWFFQPYDIGALLVRRREDLSAAFHDEPEYYRVGDPGAEPLHWYQYALEGTRRFRALKLWLSWKHLGSDGFASLIEGNVDLAAHLAARLRDAGFEVVDPELSVVCFRHVPAALVGDPDALGAHQRALQRRLEMSGDGWVSTTTLRGDVWLRAGVVNHRSTSADADVVVRVLSEAAGG